MPINHLNNLTGAVARRLGLAGPLQILAYRGYGTDQQLHFMGRVLRDDGIHPSEEDWPLWKNALNMYRRFSHDEVPGARLRLTFQGQTQEVESDSDGYFEVTVQPQQPLLGDRLWYEAEIELLDPQPDDGPVQAVIEGLVPPSRSQFGIISDIDDTIVHTDATDLWRMIRLAYMGNAQTRLPISGTPALYQALQAGKDGHSDNPVFYVSSSAWNMYDLFKEFMDLRGLPAGPIFLYALDFSLSNLLSFKHEDHKREEIEPILQEYPDLPFILIGDSGQKDPEIYAQVVRDYPNQISCIYIHSVSEEKQERQQELKNIAAEVAQLGSQMVIFSEAVTVARHAADQGWIAPDAVTAVTQAAVTQV